MKKALLCITGTLFSLVTFAQQDPIIMEIDGKPVTKSEFLQIYLKNNNDPKYDKASLDDYMELFKKFKLKVAEAEALGIPVFESTGEAHAKPGPSLVVESG